MQQVDEANSAYRAYRQSLRSLDIAVDAARQATKVASERYDRGLTDFLNVVDAERQEYEIEEQYTDAQVAVAEQFIALYRSLGGGWENYQVLPQIHRPEPAIIAVFQRVLSRDDSARVPATTP